MRFIDASIIAAAVVATIATIYTFVRRDKT